jgi:hypothetical protein
MRSNVLFHRFLIALSVLQAEAGAGEWGLRGKAPRNYAPPTSLPWRRQSVLYFKNYLKLVIRGDDNFFDLDNTF